jgi:UDP-galactopyranose mutase
VIVTAALDAFCAYQYDPLEWRGVELIGEWLPGTDYAQEAMVVNRPDLDVTHTRTIETKHVLGLDVTIVRPGTMLMYEYPGAPAHHYPVPDASGANRSVQEQYEKLCSSYQRNPIIPAGRLARYTYINMDQAMREGMTAANRVQP